MRVSPTYIRSALALACAMVSSACASVSGAGEHKSGEPDVIVSMTRVSDLNWRADLTFAEPVSQVAFVVPYDRYRLGNWSVKAPEAALDNTSGIDTLSFDVPTNQAQIFINMEERGGVPEQAASLRISRWIRRDPAAISFTWCRFQAKNSCGKMTSEFQQLLRTVFRS